MTRPCVTIDIDKIEHNARAIVGLCRRYGIEVMGVTKGTCGHPQVAKAMVRGGVSAIGESRLENIRRLRLAGVATLFSLLRIPSLSEVDDVIALADLSLNSELPVLAGLSAAALRCKRVHEVILMVDLGDLREGIWPDDLLPFVREALQLHGIRIVGLGTNLTCLSGILPSEDNMQRLASLAKDITERFGLRLRWISGVNSSGLELLAAGRMPKPINHARIGEAILLGREAVRHKAWPGTYQDAFLLRAEVLELKEKPSAPVGERGENAFGERPLFDERGDIVRAILNVGREDVDGAGGLVPLDSRLTILGASSDYLIVDVTERADRIRVGDRIAFTLDYGALLAVMTSPYVEKRSLRGGVLVETTL